MFGKKWFQTLVAFVLIFALILLISKVNFLFSPIIKYVQAVAIPIVGAGVLFYLTKPILTFLEKYRVKRIFGILIIFLLLILVGILFVMFIVPIAQNQIHNIIANTPKMVQTVEHWINLLQSNQITIPPQVNDAINNFMSNIQSHVESIVGYVFNFISQLVSFVISLALIPFFLFFMLKDGDKLVPFITQIFKKEKADNIKSLLKKLNYTLAGFIQGQIIVSFILGVLLFIGYFAMGLDYSLTLALFAMVMNVIPFLGPFLAVIPAIIVALIQDPIMVVWVLIITVIAQQTESNLISPNVMGRVLSLHPLTVITVILAAGSIAGFLGILFAVPFYAALKTIIMHFYQTYQDSKDNKKDALI
ncbi:AI-2E family transporter [Ornithinibacillus sp. 4-3]|uniref:AI-2E family transporter n=1 Tax=Ornithinibacillus sp. 4-3 TaxID=3231488 RepID=A0AB39HND3_9BACI